MFTANITATSVHTLDSSTSFGDTMHLAGNNSLIHATHPTMVCW